MGCRARRIGVPVMEVCDFAAVTLARLSCCCNDMV